MALRALCLCDGYGGFELGLKLALGNDRIRTVARVERDSHAAAVLVERMATTALDPAPVWDDLETFDGTTWRGCVDIVTAGFPCQPFSAAGQRRGIDDDRWLWPAIGRIIGDVGPRCVFLENVPGLVQHGLPHVLADLADYGFDAEWGLYSAADVGAPHRRQRFWLVATVADDDDIRRQLVGRIQPGLGARGVVDESSSPHVADTESVSEREPDHETGTITRDHPRQHSGWGGFPPRPDDTDGWAHWTAEGGHQPSIRRSPDGITGQMDRPADLADRLHLLGNGLVPQCAAAAFTQLSERLLR